MFALWLAGGGSRPDLLGQVVVRVTAFASLILAILVGLKPSLKAVWPVGAILLATLLLLLVQLVPLPPALWTALPGRNDIAFADGLSGVSQLWRPISMVPSATFNALCAVCIPFIVVLFSSSFNEIECRRLMSLLLLLIVGSTIIGLFQFSGAGYNNIFVNDTVGQVSGNFANRNHFALFLSIGCLIAPVWTFAGSSGVRQRGPVALGLVLLFVLMILASGSRAGIVTGAVSLLIGLAFTRHGLRRAFSHPPRWIFPALMIGALVIVTGIVLLSIAADRAISIDRAFALEATSDMRTRGLPVILHMISMYFPVGAGAGGFDPLFRIHEPFSLLKVTYFNHAHNDYLEIVLDTGLPGLILLAASMGWWLIASIRAWRSRGNRLLQRLGSAVLLLVFVASAFDYPARTPLMMAVIAIAAMWLAKAETASWSALPDDDQQL